MNHPYIKNLREVCLSDIGTAGGKATRLAALYKIAGIRIPTGFCISTAAFVQALKPFPEINGLLDRLALLQATDGAGIAAVSAEIRQLIEHIPLPDELIAALAQHIGEHTAYAVRSSATAEDLPSSSFAGQQDSYLNISGTPSVLEHIRKCWASLFTERAVLYRMQNGFDQRSVQLAVIVQEMIFPQASGILFTAHPVTGNRKQTLIDAGFGLGEALVSGIVSADQYTVAAGAIIDKTIATKKHQMSATAPAGTAMQELPPHLQSQQVLTTAQILELAAWGRKIEKQFGSPQDIEWCLADGQLYFLQSRPITTLFPLPEEQDNDLHIYISVGHNQMMTDAMKPLGLSFFLLTTRAPMKTAGGRLFVDVARALSTTVGRKQLLEGFGKTDLLIKDALEQAATKIPLLPEDHAAPKPVHHAPFTTDAVPADPGTVAELIRKNEASVAALRQKIGTLTGPAVFDCIEEDLEELKRMAFDPQSSALIMAAMNAALWLNENMNECLGEKNAADVLAQSVPYNVTAQMGWDLMDVADRIRPYTQVVAFLQQTKEDDFLEQLPQLEGGAVAQEALLAFLDRYGMRCAGEIDIKKPRWSEKPLDLVPALLSNIRIFSPGESRRKFEQGLKEARDKENELLQRLADTGQKTEETRQMIRTLRHFSGYREYPKYGIMARYFVYKQAMQQEVQQLVAAGVLQQQQDADYLSFAELRAAVQTRQADLRLIREREEDFKIFEKLKPPRVMTSDGEVITGTYKKGKLPGHAIAAMPVSSGVIEGRARVILDMGKANLEEGDILVTRFTDPSWTPLFVSVKGLVTEVGGLMTHGAVIAREYGLPAVVGAENATQLIRDGQRIRVNGTDGYVELLSP